MTQSILTDEQKHELIHACHDPNAWENGMVWSVWEDGEITLEKGGELFGLRICHLQEFGNVAKAWDCSLFPVINSNGSHARVYARDRDAAYALHHAILCKGVKP